MKNGGKNKMRNVAGLILSYVYIAIIIISAKFFEKAGKDCVWACPAGKIKQTDFGFTFYFATHCRKLPQLSCKARRLQKPRRPYWKIQINH